MVMPMCPVHMAVGDFFFGRGPHFQHMSAKAQRLASQGVVCVEDDFVALNLDNRKGASLAIGVSALQLPADFDPWRELGFGDGLQQRLVALAKCVGHR